MTGLGHAGADSEGEVSAGAVLAALAEPRRAAIVSLLEERHRSQKGLAGALAMSQPLVSHHLRILRDAGLVTSTVCDRVTVYLLNPRTLRALSRRLEGAAERAEAVESVAPC